MEKLFKRIISISLCFVLTLSLIGTTVYAEEVKPVAEETETEEPETEEQETEEPEIEEPEIEEPETEEPETEEQETEEPETEEPETEEPETEEPETEKPETGWKYKDGNWYYFNAEGAMQTGWIYVDGYWYYLDAEGIMQTGWIYVDGYWYFMDLSGSMHRGWLKTGDYWYYLNKNSGCMHTDWVYVDGYWYHMSKIGVMETSTWIEENGKYYYVNSNGCMVVSDYTYDGYYVNANGEWSWDHWVEDNNGWWYSLKEGGWAAGWKYINKNWYYFDENSGYMQTGFVYSEGNWYYLSDSGSMYAGDLYRIGNAFYAFDAYGIMLRDTSYYFNGGYVPLCYDGYVTGTAAEVLLKADNVLNYCGRSMWDAFQWTINNIKYSSKHMSGIGPGANDVQSLWYANHGFDYRLGNCYVEAAAFCWMSRLLGVETHFIKGHVVTKNGKSRHGWCEAVIDGEIRVFDLTFSQSGRDGYNKKYGEKGTWKYVEYERVL